MGLMPFADAMFLTPESREQPMHVGGLQLFRYPEGADERWLGDVVDRLLASPDVAPLFRRRPERSALTLGAWWKWVEDDDVDLGYHVRHSALPRPGRVRELLDLVGRLHGNLLDRNRPLWEAHLVEGLEGDRFAVYTKLHHSLLDGVSALRLLQRSLSTDPAEDTPVPWAPRPRPPRSAGGSGGPGGAAGALADLATFGPRLMSAGAEALRDQAVRLPAPAPHSMFNVGITGSRRYAAQSWSLDDVRRVGRDHGATVNDVILAMCGGALRSYMRELDALPHASLVAMTPVSLRTSGDVEEGGNATGAVLCAIGTDTDDAIGRLEGIRDQMTATKRLLRGLSQLQATALGAAVLFPMLFQAVGAGRRLVPPTYNLVVSNLPGPQQPLYWQGAEMQGMYPLSIPLAGQALNITVTSYRGSLDFGLTGCRRSVPHLQRLLGHLDDALAQLSR
jgi:diacylglycerol O-acyltransferase